MCTSYVFRDNSVIIGMNFDNDGKKFKIVLRDESQFIIMVEVNGRFYPSFGVNRNGTFINNLMVDSNGMAPYKRQTQDRWVVSTLIERVLSEDIKFDELSAVLKQKTLVNGPYFSTHSMVADKSGNVHILEPGRSNLFSPSSETAFYVMTNFPLSGHEHTEADKVQGSGADRYKTAYARLSKASHPFGVDDGFDVLEKVKQVGEEWITEFSMVFLPNEQVVFFTINGDFEKRFKFSFSDRKISTDKGFEKNNSIILTGRGVSKSDIEKL